MEEVAVEALGQGCAPPSSSTRWRRVSISWMSVCVLIPRVELLEPGALALMCVAPQVSGPVHATTRPRGATAPEIACRGSLFMLRPGPVEAAVATALDYVLATFYVPLLMQFLCFSCLSRPHSPFLYKSHESPC